MPVALENFEAPYDGKRVRIRKGISRVADDHELVRRYPSRFGPDSKKVSAARSRLVRSARVAPTASQRYGGSAIDRTVTIGRAAADSPTIFVTRAAVLGLDLVDFGDGLGEQGGGLFGNFVGRDVLRIEGITEASPYAPHLRRPNSVRLDTEALEVYAEHYARNGWRRLGDYHSHPQSARAIPSEGDLRGWSVMAERLNRPYLGMIVTPGFCGEESDDWSRWKVSSWLVRPGSTEAVPLSRVTFAAVHA
jgi:hypothetical protein